MFYRPQKGFLNKFVFSSTGLFTSWRVLKNSWICLKFCGARLLTLKSAKESLQEHKPCTSDCCNAPITSKFGLPMPSFSLSTVMPVNRAAVLVQEKKKQTLSALEKYLAMGTISFFLFTFVSDFLSFLCCLCFMF
jgi:hypothetical protein